MEVRDQDVIVTLDYEGEGYSGDYDPTDPLDRQLLRFSVLIERGPDGVRDQVDDASYCTNLCADLSEDDQRRVCEYIMSEVRDRVMHGVSVKKLCEWLSWVQIEETPSMRVPHVPQAAPRPLSLRQVFATSSTTPPQEL